MAGEKPGAEPSGDTGVPPPAPPAQGQPPLPRYLMGAASLCRTPPRSARAGPPARRSPRGPVGVLASKRSPPARKQPPQEQHSARGRFRAWPHGSNRRSETCGKNGKRSLPDVQG